MTRVGETSVASRRCLELRGPPRADRFSLVTDSGARRCLLSAVELGVFTDLAKERLPLAVFGLRARCDTRSSGTS